jgi:hypothetical protein
MGDDNMENIEDTSVLFVSGQKKKKAEEEAQQKAAQEQAEKEAREAELRRKEAEVASRINKAEDVKKALDVKEEALNKHKTKNRLMPIFIGAGIAVVLLFVIALWPKPKKAYLEAAEFNAEYTVSGNGYGLKIKYPDTVFTEVTENPSDEKVDVAFRVSGKEYPAIDVVVNKVGYNKVERNIGWETINEELIEVSKSYLQGAEIIEEFVSDPTDTHSEKSNKYVYKCTFTRENQNGAYTAWCTEDSEGTVFVEGALCLAGKDDMESAVRLRDQFESVNGKDSLVIPGKKELKNLEPKEMLNINNASFGLLVPENMYMEMKSSEDASGSWQTWVDENGAIILVGMLPYGDKDSFTAIPDDQMYILYDIYQEQIEKDLENKVKYTDRNLISTKAAPNFKTDYRASYQLKVGGREYFEEDYMMLDFEDEKIYAVLIYFLAPRYQDGSYKEVFNNLFGQNSANE